MFVVRHNLQAPNRHLYTLLHKARVQQSQDQVPDCFVNISTAVDQSFRVDSEMVKDKRPGIIHRHSSRHRSLVELRVTVAPSNLLF